MTENPYGKYVAGEDVIASLDTTSRRIAAIVGAWEPETYERRYAAGKWSGRQILVHLAQSEMVFSNRLRFGLAQDGYVVQPFEQDPWMAVETAGDGRAALDAYLALRQMNLAMCRGLSPAQRTRTFMHPERGPIDVDWVMTMFAGHERHHLPQIEAIGAS